MRFLICLLFATVTTTNLLAQVDTDGDGLLDLMDVPGFNPNREGLRWVQTRDSGFNPYTPISSKHAISIGP